MYPALVHLEGSEGVPKPWLCTFRKSELWRGKTTDAGSRYTVSILLYNCTDPEPDLKCRTHTCEFIANCGKTLPLPTSVDKSYSHQIHTTLLNQRYVPYQYIVTTLAVYNHMLVGPLVSILKKPYPTMKCVPHYIPPPTIFPLIHTSVTAVFRIIGSRI